MTRCLRVAYLAFPAEVWQVTLFALLVGRAQRASVASDPETTEGVTVNKAPLRRLLPELERRLFTSSFAAQT